MSLRGELQSTPLMGPQYGPMGHRSIPLADVVNILAEKLMQYSSRASNAAARHSIDDTLTTLPNLVNGLDLNVRFRKPDDYEPTKETAIFDLAGVNIFHGWLVDPQKEEAAVLCNKSYNQCLTELTTEVQKVGTATPPPPPAMEQSSAPSSPQQPPPPTAATEDADANADDSKQAAAPANDGGAAEKSEPQSAPPPPPATSKLLLFNPSACHYADAAERDEPPPHPSRAPQQQQQQQQQKPAPYSPTGGLAGESWERETMRQWLLGKSTQLTDYGLERVRQAMKPGEFACFFRNNHYSVMTKDSFGRLLLLITDEGLAESMPRMAWESLSDLSGGGSFVGPIHAAAPVASAHTAAAFRPQQIHMQPQQRYNTPPPQPGSTGAHYQTDRRGSGGQGTDRGYRRQRKSDDDDCCTIQ